MHTYVRTDEFPVQNHLKINTDILLPRMGTVTLYCNHKLLILTSFPRAHVEEEMENN